MNSSRFDALVGPAYSYPSKPVDCQECINFECLKVGSASSPYPSMLVSTAGTKSLKFRIFNTDEVLDEIPTVNASKTRVRGIHRCSVPFAGDSFEGVVVVGADAVWRVDPPDSDGVCTIRRLGVISEGQGPVDIMDAGGESGSTYPQKILIADGNTMYSVNMDTGVFSSLGNSVPQRPESLAYIDGRVYMSGTVLEDGKPSQRIYWSDLNDPDSWGQDFVSASARSDPVRALATAGNYLFMVGSETYEVWQTSTSPLAPIRRVNGVAGGVGTSNGKSVKAIASSVFFVGGGDTGRLRVYQGESNGSVNVVSTDAMSQEFATYPTMDGATGMCWADDGQVYYGITIPEADVTWVYNVGQKLWHKRKSTVDSEQHRWKVDVACNAFGTVLGGSVDSGRLYDVSRKYNDDDGVEIVRRRVSPHLRSDGKLLNHVSLEIDVECGNALPYGQGSDPQVMLRALDGAGRIAGDPRWKSTGTQGMYRRRVKWWQLGCAVDRCYEICVSDPIRWTFYGAVLETEEAGR